MDDVGGHGDRSYIKMDGRDVMEMQALRTSSLGGADASSSSQERRRPSVTSVGSINSMSMAATAAAPAAASSGRMTRAASMPVEVNFTVGETSPAYKALKEAGLIVTSYQLAATWELDLIPSNSDILTVWCRRLAACMAVPVLGALVYPCIVKEFCVQEGCIRRGWHSNGSYFFFGSGVHRIVDPFLHVEKRDTEITEPIIQHGDRTIATVPQGFVGLAFDRGQPVILPPGLHQWRSDTLRIQKLIDLSAAVICIGPFTLLTVDEGYAAVTQDNGKQRVLPGGRTHMLTHRNWKFESFMSLKIHTDDLGPVSTTTADNVVLSTTATVNWRIVDPARAARMAADTMPGSSEDRKLMNPNANPVLRDDVLKQALASLAAAIGNVRYAGDAHISASRDITVMNLTDMSKTRLHKAREEYVASATASARSVDSLPDTGLASIFSVNQMTAAVRHANEICSQYGVCIMNINIVSAFPEDAGLTKALSAGAVASASAEQAEMASRGNAKAKLIASQAAGEAMRISARADADAERVKAQGKQDAAALLRKSQVAIDLAKMERASELMSPNATFFFGAGSDVSAGL
eukprot:CAMPEP_0178410356 /NCGR_PEP_ID=MMETSP0689_2-20121128/20936_1 /TAXON_ID=160604 /ORGANISM="Amphidinium massartii, Strain CS-259" /LENGTH=577 /DNA_ID=CAMNT_0020031527 /DNA_START=68 /DNA_END=1797 /DNA_ORIENTATION=-